jgi:hypothetical protein
MGSTLDSNFSSAPLASTNPESQQEYIRRLEAELVFLRQDLHTKEWILQKRLEDEVYLRVQLYSDMATMQKCLICSVRSSARVHNHPATSQAASHEAQDMCIYDPILVDPYLSATESTGSYYLGLLNRFYSAYEKDFGISPVNFIATVTHPHFPKGYLHFLYAFGLGYKLVSHLGFVQSELNKRGPHDPGWRTQQVTERLVLTMSDRESVKQGLLPLIVQQFHALYNFSPYAVSGTG